MILSLSEKKAIICGSTQGIGLAIAEELALLGANCTLLARNEEALQKAVLKLDTQLRQQHEYLVADFAQPDQVKKVIEKYVSDNTVHILINNTGGPPAGAIAEAEEQDFLHAFNQHLVCNHILVKSVLPGMKKENFGRIVNVISTSVKIPLPNLGVSNTIRGAVASWAKTLANELGQFNITVNNVLPGYTATQRLTSIIDNKLKKGNGTAEEIENAMMQKVPMRRFAAPAEVAAVAAFLASPAASYVNGVSIPVDGGRTGSI
ncbi:MAG: SDR family oxidoreductase [Chitinophagaceae bacterium]|nr:SDR family oxidoreductase [Chitinophagaceae bacterium]MCB0740221.1 SDR family oxidoreductase [Chitinophagaceae bacterium]HQV06771.1 SDR family oxidoreductase [Chitinophagaceae bacterium]